MESRPINNTAIALQPFDEVGDLIGLPKLISEGETVILYLEAR